MSETLSQDGRAYLRAFEQDRTPLGVSEEIARLKQQLHDTRDELRVYRLASEQAIYDAQQYDPTLYLNTDRGVEDVMRRVLARLGEYEGADKRWHSFETAQAIAEERDALRRQLTDTQNQFREFMASELPFLEWAQSYLDSGRWAGHDMLNAIKTELLERDAELLAARADARALAEVLCRLDGADTDELPFIADDASSVLQAHGAKYLTQGFVL